MEEKECLGNYKNESNKCRSCRDKEPCLRKQYLERIKKYRKSTKSAEFLKQLINITPS